MKWNLFDRFVKKFQSNPNIDLKMELIQQYSMIIPKTEIARWRILGWVEVPGYHNFHYAPTQDETVMFGMPKTLRDVNTNLFIHKKIVDYGLYYGSYGMGGPGFLGFGLEGADDALVYAVWGADEYILMDDKVVACDPIYYESYHPWISQCADEGIPQWDDFTPMIVDSIISDIELTQDKCLIMLSKGDRTHKLEFLKNDVRLPPMGNGTARVDAFKTGSISDHIILQHKKAVLWV